MIKVVRIYTKADALSTGAILVDLPGVHDSNAARAAVAAGYLKKCTGLVSSRDATFVEAKLMNLLVDRCANWKSS